MATQTASGDEPVLTDRGRWDGEVVAQGRFWFKWGTYQLKAEYQKSRDGEGHLTVAAPSDPPPDATEIVAGGLAGGPAARRAAAVLADGWGIDVDELVLDDAAPAIVEEVSG